MREMGIRGGYWFDFFFSSSSLESTEWLYHKKYRLLLETMSSFAKLPRLSRAMELPVRNERTHWYIKSDHPPFPFSGIASNPNFYKSLPKSWPLTLCRCLKKKLWHGLCIHLSISSTMNACGSKIASNLPLNPSNPLNRKSPPPLIPYFFSHTH